MRPGINVFERLISFMTGYVEVLIRGPHLEKIINLISGSGLWIWEIKRVGTETLHAKIRTHGFLRLRDPVRRSGAVVKILHKRGWPFLWRQLVQRKFLVLGGLLFILFLTYLSTFVFVIKIDGFEGRDRDTLLDTLQQAGLKPGMTRRTIFQEKDRIEQETMMKTPEAVWLGITLRGVVAEVRVVRRKEPPPPSPPCDLVAGQSGLITKMVVVRGQPVVKEGDTVSRGDLLISGMLWETDPDSGEQSFREIPARGKVEARTWYDFVILEPKIVWKASPQKSRVVEYKLRWGRKCWILVRFGKISGSSYAWTRWSKHIFRGRNPENHVELIKDTYQEIKWRREIRTVPAIQRLARAELQKRLQKKGMAKETKLTEQWSLEGNFIKLAVTVETSRDIAIPAPRGKEHAVTFE